MNESDSTSMVQRRKYKIGRPSEYRPCIIKKLYDYFNNFKSDGTSVLPTFEQFNQQCKISTQAFQEWRTAFPDFGVAYKNCLEIQKQWLTNGALSERYNPGFTKFLMINNHGMVSENSVQKTDANINVSGGIRIAWTDATSNQW